MIDQQALSPSVLILSAHKVDVFFSLPPPYVHLFKVSPKGSALHSSQARNTLALSSTLCSLSYRYHPLLLTAPQLHPHSTKLSKAARKPRPVDAASRSTIRKVRVLQKRGGGTPRARTTAPAILEILKHLCFSSGDSTPSRAHRLSPRQ